MNLFNYYGLIILVILMIPNIIYASTNKDAFSNKVNNKILELLEQIGRYGSFIFLIFNIPHTYNGFWFKDACKIYLIINFFLLFIYLLFWIITWKKNTLAKSLVLSITPSLIFLFSSVMIVSVPLFITSILFAITHISISVSNCIN